MTSSPPPKSPQQQAADTIKDNHLSHVSMLLRMVQIAREREDTYGGGRSPTNIFFGGADAEMFWELIGFRVRGQGSLLLGAIRFKRQQSRFNQHARQSLVSYLCSPPKELGLGKTARPSNLIEVVLPEASEKIPEFLTRLQEGGGELTTIHIDVNLIEFAFDFRIENPSEERHVKMHRRPPALHVLRTVAGHVLAGSSQALHEKLHRDQPFFALVRPVQYTPRGKLILPTLAVHRSFFSTELAIDSETPTDHFVQRYVPFLPATANPAHLFSTTAFGG